MARTITTNTAAGITLTNTGDSPVTIASGVSIGNASGIGLQSSQAFYWTVTNANAATIAGTTFGVSLGSAGSVTNSGTVTSSYATGNGFTYNSTTRAFGVLSAAVFVGGGVTSGSTVLTGSISNSASGVINGGLEGAALGAPGTVVNAGKISAGSTSVNVGFGVALATGGAVTNQTGGSIYASDYGVFSDGALNVTNAANAVITSANRGIFAVNSNAAITNQGTLLGGRYGIKLLGGAGTITNTGSIAGTSTVGVYLTAGGTISNTAAAASIAGGYDGILVAGAAGTLTNSGTIQDTIPVTSQTFTFGGVLLASGGSISNASNGLIRSTSFGAWINGSPGTIVNTGGTIASYRTFGGAGAALIAGGTLTNANTTLTNGGGTVTSIVSGFITSEWIGVQSGVFNASVPSAAGVVTIDNAGTIEAADGHGDGAGLWVHGPGVIINRPGAAIDPAPGGTIAGGPLNGLANGGFGVVAYYQTTLTNYGYIGGTSFSFDAAGTSPTVGNLIRVSPSGTFASTVLGAHTSTQASLSTLELMSASSAGVINGFGSHYQNFGNITIDNGARWTLGGTVASGTTVAFASGGAGALTVSTPSSFQGTITGFSPGETLTLAGVTATTGVSLSSSGNVLTVNGAALTLQFDPAQSFAGKQFTQQVSGGSTNISLVACFAAGTRILTDEGPMAVETLREGMRAMTHRGAPAEIVWIGTRTIDCTTHPDPARVWPVRVRAGAFGRGKPSRDLMLSPDHAVFVDGVLIPIQYLCNGRTIQQVEVPRVTYFHVELPEHAVVLAEDLPVESYLDTGDRANFSNASGPVRLHPDFSAKVWEMEGCAPLVIAGPQVERVRRRLAKAAPARIEWARTNNRYTYY